MRVERVAHIKRTAEKCGARFFIYELTAPKTLLFKRIAERPKLLDKPKVSQARVERNYRIYMEQHKKPLGVVFDVEKLSAEQVARKILKDLTL